MIREIPRYETWDGKEFAEKENAVGNALRGARAHIAMLNMIANDDSLTDERKLADIEDRADKILEIIRYGD